MMRSLLVLTVATAIVATSSASSVARAQSRTFLFVDAPTWVERQRSELLYDAAYGDRSFQSLDGNGLLQRLSASVWLSPHLGLIARSEAAPNEGRQRFSHQVELQWRVPNRATPLAFALGARREFQGTNVLVGAVAAARELGHSSFGARLGVEHPFEDGRDAIDLITAVGWSRRLTRLASVSLEAVGQDLEGFWEAEEAEGGARLFLGPSFALSPESRRWSLVIGGGPVLRATGSPRSSSAPRDLIIDRHSSYVARTSLRWVM